MCRCYWHMSHYVGKPHTRTKHARGNFPALNSADNTGKKDVPIHIHRTVLHDPYLWFIADIIGQAYKIGSVHC